MNSSERRLIASTLREVAVSLTKSVSAASSVYVDVKDLPLVLQKALKRMRYNSRNIELKAATTISFKRGASDGNRGYNVIVDLRTGDVREEVGSWGGSNPWSKSLTDLDDTKRALPDNVVQIKGEYGGRGSYAVIYVNPKTLVPMLPAKEDLSEDELKALGIIAHYKSGYRKDEFARKRLGRYDPTNPLIVSLIAKGMLKKTSSGALSITTKGRNAAPGYGY